MLPEVPVHVIQRGNNRQRCFHQEQDRSFYLFHLDRLLGSSGCTLHAYCLMTNHVHLLLTASSPDGCARLMKHLGQLHSQYFNRNYGRSGSLWEGRFRSCLVQSEDYVLACYRYIELNPVRAGLASTRASTHGRATAPMPMACEAHQLSRMANTCDSPAPNWRGVRRIKRCLAPHWRRSVSTKFAQRPTATLPWAASASCSRYRQPWAGARSEGAQVDRRGRQRMPTLSWSC